MSREIANGGRKGKSDVQLRFQRYAMRIKRFSSCLPSDHWSSISEIIGTQSWISRRGKGGIPLRQFIGNGQSPPHASVESQLKGKRKMVNKKHKRKRRKLATRCGQLKVFEFAKNYLASNLTRCLFDKAMLNVRRQDENRFVLTREHPEPENSKNSETL